MQNLESFIRTLPYKQGPGLSLGRFGSKVSKVPQRSREAGGFLRAGLLPYKLVL